MFRRDPNSEILDAQRRSGFSRLERNFNRLTPPVLHRVGKEVGNHLVELQRVPFSRDSRRDRQAQGAFGGGKLIPETIGNLLHQRR